MISKPHLTQHAQKRKQQRGITDNIISLIEVFGESKYQKGGSEVLYISKKRQKDLQIALDKINGIQVIACNDGEIITVQHEY